MKTTESALRDALVLLRSAVMQSKPAIMDTRVASNGPTVGDVVRAALGKPGPLRDVVVDDRGVAWSRTAAPRLGVPTEKSKLRGPVGPPPERVNPVGDNVARPAVRVVGRYDAPGHPLHGSPLLRRETGLLEVHCAHGIGHPIPESVAHMEKAARGGGAWGVHGCDGCCRGLAGKKASS